MDRRKRSRSRSRSNRRHYKHVEYSYKEHSKTRITYSRSRSPDRSRSKRSPQRRHNERRRSRTPPRYRSRSRSGYRSRSRSSSRRRHYNDRYRNRRSNSRSRSNERRQPREYNDRNNERYNERHNERYNGRESYSQSTVDKGSSSQGFMEIFKLLYEFRKEIIEYLNSAFESQVRPLEIFMRWYLNSLPSGAKDYFMPISFTAQENDIDYYQHSMRPNVTKQAIITSVQTIWDKYKNKRYFSKAGDKSYLITEDQERRLRNLYTGSEKDYDRFKNLLLAAYEFMGNMNNHLSVPPAIFSGTKIVELFGSPINTSQTYCSPFKLEQENFGSQGSFFEYEIREGLHIANPPFDETLMEQMADRLEAQLALREGITVICIIPVWDPESQAKHGLKNFNKRFIAFEKLVGSKYFKENHYLGKEEYPFWNYYKKAYIPASHSHFIVLSNEEELPFKSAEVIEKWKKLN